MVSETQGPALLGDLGATNARFAILDKGTVAHVRILACADYVTIDRAVRAYLGGLETRAPVRQMALAVACPVIGDTVKLTNNPWSFSQAALKAELGLERLEVVNDFVAQALAVPQLAPGDTRQIGGGTARAGQPIGIVGPGTGLGMSVLLPLGEGWLAIPGEGGHATMAAADDREAEILGRLRRRYGHVSAERVISGMGLTNLYETLAAMAGEKDVIGLEPWQVTESARSGANPHCVEAVQVFARLLGTVAGNLALTVGALGGIYLSGGIILKLGALFDDAGFRDRFEAKGRFRNYLEAVPVHVVTNDLPAFLGLKTVLGQHGTSTPGQTELHQ